MLVLVLNLACTALLAVASLVGCSKFDGNIAMLKFRFAFKSVVDVLRESVAAPNNGSNGSNGAK